MYLSKNGAMSINPDGGDGSLNVGNTLGVIFFQVGRGVSALPQESNLFTLRCQSRIRINRAYSDNRSSGAEDLIRRDETKAILT